MTERLQRAFGERRDSIRRLSIGICLYLIAFFAFTAFGLWFDLIAPGPEQTTLLLLYTVTILISIAVSMKAVYNYLSEIRSRLVDQGEVDKDTGEERVTAEETSRLEYLARMAYLCTYCLLGLLVVLFIVLGIWIPDKSLDGVSVSISGVLGALVMLMPAFLIASACPRHRQPELSPSVPTYRKLLVPGLAIVIGLGGGGIFGFSLGGGPSGSSVRGDDEALHSLNATVDALSSTISRQNGEIRRLAGDMEKVATDDDLRALAHEVRDLDVSVQLVMRLLEGNSASPKP